MPCPWCGEPMRLDQPDAYQGCFGLECENTSCWLMSMNLLVANETEAAEFLKRLENPCPAQAADTN